MSRRNRWNKRECGSVAGVPCRSWEMTHFFAHSQSNMNEGGRFIASKPNPNPSFHNDLLVLPKDNYQVILTQPNGGGLIYAEQTENEEIKPEKLSMEYFENLVIQ